MTDSTYHVTTGHWLDALVYRSPEMSTGLYGILATRSSGYRPPGGVTIVQDEDLRPATHLDFDRFRICWKGHLPPPPEEDCIWHFG